MGIYNADIYCDDCSDKIKLELEADGTVAKLEAAGVDIDDERTYDSDEYPKWSDTSAESDSPEHCGGCGVFLENSLTSYGEGYVVEQVNIDLIDGCMDSVAVTEWMDYYDYLEYVEQCAGCGDYHYPEDLNGYDECLDCGDEEDDDDE